MTAADEQARQIAGRLSKAAKRAVMKLGRDWIDEGSPGPSRGDAYSLGWGRAGNLGLVDRMTVGYGVDGPCWRYRLTPLGLRVQAALREMQGETK